MYKVTTYMLFSNIIMNNLLYFIKIIAVYFLLLLQTGICKPIF